MSSKQTDGDKSLIMHDKHTLLGFYCLLKYYFNFQQIIHCHIYC